MARDIGLIRRDIEETRGRLRETAEAIGWKADVPARARDVVRETAAVIRERVSTGSRTRHGSDGPSLGSRASDAAAVVGSGAGDVKDAVDETAGRVKETIGDGVSAITDSLEHGGDAVASGAATAKDAARHGAEAIGAGAAAARDAVSSGKDAAAGAIERTRDAVASRLPSSGEMSDSAHRAGTGVRSNALGLTVAALVVGVTAGLMLPVSRVEKDRLGPVADELRERGADLGGTAIARGREAVEEVASAVGG